MDLLTLLVVATGTALATGLGALPFAFVGTMSERWIGVSNALAAGSMVGASIGLLYEGMIHNGGGTLLGVVAGAIFISITHRYLHEREAEAHLGALRGAGAIQALLVLGVMTMHSFTEGVALGVSAADDGALGIVIALAIALHNIPEGLAISLALVPSGVSPLKAAGWSIFSSLPQPLMAIPAFLGVRLFEPLLPAGLGFAGGAMLWMVVTQLIPEARAHTSRSILAPVVALSTAGMIAIELAIAF